MKYGAQARTTDACVLVCYNFAAAGGLSGSASGLSGPAGVVGLPRTAAHALCLSHALSVAAEEKERARGPQAAGWSDARWLV